MNLLIEELLRALAVVFADPTLGKKGATLETVLLAAAAATSLGQMGVEALRQLTDHINGMAAAGTEPTDEDWDALKARSDQAHAMINGTWVAPQVEEVMPSEEGKGEGEG